MPQLIRSVLSTALDTTARVLSVASGALNTTARLLRPPSEAADFPLAPTPAPAAPTADVIDRVQASPAAERVGRVAAPPPTPVLDEQPHQRTSESHIFELAERPVADVVRAVDTLSTDELRLLTEYETSHRNRKRVLQAIERALLPVPSGGPPSNGAG